MLSLQKSTSVVPASMQASHLNSIANREFHFERLETFGKQF